MGKIEFARGFVWTVRVDFVLAYQIYEDETEEWREKRERKRKRFFGRLETEGLELEEDRVRDGKNSKHAPRPHMTPTFPLGFVRQEDDLRQNSRAVDLSGSRSGTAVHKNACRGTYKRFITRLASSSHNRFAFRATGKQLRQTFVVGSHVGETQLLQRAIADVPRFGARAGIHYASIQQGSSREVRNARAWHAPSDALAFF